MVNSLLYRGGGICRPESWQTVFSSLRTIFMILVLASISAGSAGAATLQVLIDTDNSAASGCTVTLPSPPGGTFPGVEVVLTTTVDTSTTPPSVTGVTQQLCNTATHTLGTAAVVSPGGWNVAMGAGVGGYDAIETVYTPASLAGAYRLGFTYTDGAIGSDVLTASGSGPGATPIVFALAAESSAVGVPGLQGGGVLLLSALLAGAMIWGLRRYRAPTLLVFALVSCILAGGTWAAITLDGSVADWTGISPLAADATGDGPAGADIAAVFASTATSPNRVFFRADVKVAAKPGITSSDHASFSVGTAGSFTVTTSGTPVPSLSRGGVALPGGVSFTDNGNGTGTLSGTPAAASDGSYALNFTASNLVGSSPAQAFTLTVTKQTQTITFASTAPSNPALGGAPYVVSATATSGLPVTFSIAPAAASVCTIAGNTVSYTGAGTCVINANQAGDSTYGAAPQVQQSFAVAKTAQTISFTSSAPVAATVGGPPMRWRPRPPPVCPSALPSTPVPQPSAASQGVPSPLLATVTAASTPTRVATPPMMWHPRCSRTLPWGRVARPSALPPRPPPQRRRVVPATASPPPPRRGCR